MLHAAVETTNEDYQIRHDEKRCFTFFVSAGDAGMTPVEMLLVLLSSEDAVNASRTRAARISQPKSQCT
jgi:hypothetical protein